MRIGLALSGGGFRATLYHLGLIRFLRDSDLLARVSHITSVSGGSVLAAHLVVNWDRYCGTAEQFDAAAQEILRMGCGAVLVKGGHLTEDATDVLFDGVSFTTFTSRRLDSRNTHGTGCTTAAAIAANLALGRPLTFDDR